MMQKKNKKFICINKVRMFLHKYILQKQIFKQQKQIFKQQKQNNTSSERYLHK